MMVKRFFLYVIIFLFNQKRVIYHINGLIGLRETRISCLFFITEQKKLIFIMSKSQRALLKLSVLDEIFELIVLKHFIICFILLYFYASDNQYIKYITCMISPKNIKLKE